ncbi:MAG: GNAT family N-acetyltransferase [Pseudomonadota bacterium]
MFPAGCRTPRLVLRPLGDDDADAVVSVTHHPTVISAVPFIEAPFDTDAARDLIARNADQQDRFYGIWLGEDRTLVGVIGVHLRDEDAVEIGYWLAPKARGQGIASEAARAMAERISTVFPDRTIIAECRPENAASWRVLQKAGFRDTGRPGTRPGRKLLTWQ